MTKARFVHGSVSRHIMAMSATNAIGISALFLSDLIDIYFISLLGQSSYTAAIGYASSIILFSTSICIALVTVNSAIVAKYIGQNEANSAKQHVCLIACFAFLSTTVFASFLFYFTPSILLTIGAQDEQLQHAIPYLRTLLLSLPILAVALQMSATLRSFGYAKYAMLATLCAAILNITLDPILIFYCQLDLQGAAIASVSARLLLLLIGLYFVISKFRLITFFTIAFLKENLKIIFHYSLPALLTQLIAPLGAIYVTYEMAKFGSEYMSGWAIISRIIPLAFVMLFALPGAIGPIISQNYGAKNTQRLREVLNQSLKFIISYTLVIAMSLSMLQEFIVDIFNSENESAQLIRIFCQNIPITFIFVGMTLVSLSFLNNLGVIKIATFLNFAKVTLGTIPLVSLGGKYFNAPGILYGHALGNILFGLISLILVYNVIKLNEHKAN